MQISWLLALEEKFKLVPPTVPHHLEPTSLGKGLAVTRTWSPGMWWSSALTRHLVGDRYLPALSSPLGVMAQSDPC